MHVGEELSDRKHSACILTQLFSEFFVDRDLESLIMLGLIIVDTYHQMIEQKLLDSCWMACREPIETFILLGIIYCIFS